MTNSHQVLSGKADRLVLLRGSFLVLFGLMAFVWAGPAASALVLAFGVFALADGLVLAAMYFRHRALWGRSSLFLGVVSMLVGIYALSFPGLTAFALVAFIAARAAVGGIIELRMAARMRKHFAGEWVLVTNGVLALLFGGLMLVMLLLRPTLAILVLTEAIGLYAMLAGLLLLAVSSRMRTFRKKTDLML